MISQHLCLPKPWAERPATANFDPTGRPNFRVSEPVGTFAPVAHIDGLPLLGHIVRLGPGFLVPKLQLVRWLWLKKPIPKRVTLASGNMDKQPLRIDFEPHPGANMVRSAKTHRLRREATRLGKMGCF